MPYRTASDCSGACRGGSTAICSVIKNRTKVLWTKVPYAGRRPAGKLGPNNPPAEGLDPQCKRQLRSNRQTSRVLSARTDDEPSVRLLAQRKSARAQTKQKLCPLNHQKHPSPNLPSACLAPERLVVIAGKSWLMPVRLLSPNLPPALPLRKLSLLWMLCSRRSLPWRLSALIQERR